MFHNLFGGGRGKGDFKSALSCTPPKRFLYYMWAMHAWNRALSWSPSHVAFNYCLLYFYTTWWQQTLEIPETILLPQEELKVKNDHRSKFSNLSNWKEEAWKKISGLQRDSNPWPPRYWCVALPTELWSHTLGARSIYWVHISREEWNDVKYNYEIIHFWTAVVDKSEEWSSQ